MSDSYRMERERMVENQLEKRGIRINSQVLEIAPSGKFRGTGSFPGT